MTSCSIINTDFKPRSLATSENLGKPSSYGACANQHWRLRSLILACGFAVLGMVLAKTDSEFTKESAPEFSAAEILMDTPVSSPASAIELNTSANQAEDVPIAVDYNLEPPVGEIVTVEPEVDLLRWRKVVVKAGDTFSTLCKDLGFHDQYLEIFHNKTAARHLRRIHPGQTIQIGIGQRGIEELKLQPNESELLHLVRNDIGEFEAQTEPLAFDSRIKFASGQISHSLFMAGRDAGLSGKMVMQMAGILGWDIDFSLDVRRGDTFNVIYEQRYRDNKPFGDGEILAAEYANQGKTYRAYRHTLKNGDTDYFTEDGRSVRKAFLRSPVNFARISSPFNMYRKHPVLNRIRAHKGVDYAARTGTPIMAAGDGKIIFRGSKGGYGSAVILQHDNANTTLYGHMSRFKTGQRVGSRVRQGDIIGYVGSSGLATGPHLHYEFRIAGVHHNPVTVKLPKAEPLPTEELAAFQTAIRPMQARLELYDRRLASAQPSQSK